MADPSTESAATIQWLARIRVTLKPVVLDPQGDAVLTGLHQLGFGDVAAVRVGKYVEVTLAAQDHAAAEAAVRAMCDRLLANPVIERYDFDVEGKASGAGR
ncbi:MAG TPA: phosphoribosylformylglycinamidine synthase subunit PurS [Ktedonobacterales bacterium]|nr:phosphoribosylformylglycinamidine synthase subunit PurS [Ktedonobacterales bacterium]